MTLSKGEVALRFGATFAVLLSCLMFDGSVAAQTKTQLAQCADRNPDVVILGCTRVIASRDASAEFISLALNNRAVAYEARGRNDLAMADLNEAIKRDSTNPHAWVNRGNLYLAQGQFERALADYTQDIAIHPNNPAV